MSIFTKRRWLAKMVLGKPSASFCIPWWQGNINTNSMQNLIKIYIAVQMLWAFLLKDVDWPKWCSANPQHRFAYHGGRAILILIVCKIWLKYTMRFKCYEHFTKRRWLAKMVLGKPSASFCIPWWQGNINTNSMQNLIQISRKVQKLWGFY